MQLAFAKKAACSGSPRNSLRIFSRKGLCAAGISVLLFIFGCTTPRVTEVNPGEKQRQDYAIGVALAQQFEGEFDLRNDPAISRYLEELATALLHSSPSLNENPPRIRIIKDRGRHWRNYAFPGNRLYLSRSLLRSIKFENELAASIALELAHLDKRDVVTRYEKLPPNSNLFEEGGLFDFPPEAQRAALESAMEMMYQAGFDPRGMVRLLGRYQENPDQSPYNEIMVKALMENSWQIIALHAPLRNPIIRSDRFLAVYQRMQKL